MATNYGNFEVVSELFKTHRGMVCSARWAETSDGPNTCLKVIELDQSMLQDRDTAIAEELLVAAALQKTMSNKSEFWAPVYELGSNGTNAYYASKLYPRSLQTVIDSHIRLTPAQLQTILLAIVDGLIDLDTAYHRQHCNLKPSNVLLADQSRFTSDGVFLADPDAVGDEVPSLTRAPDTKAIGQILYSLVTHKPHTAARLPLQKSPHWKQLGSSGPQWFALCESLLDTFSNHPLPTLETIRLRIGKIRPSARRIPRMVLAALLIGAAGAAAYWDRADLGRHWQQSRNAALGVSDPYFPTQPVAISPPKAAIPAINPAMKPDGTIIAKANSTDHAPTIKTVPLLSATQPTAPPHDALADAIKSSIAPEMNSLPAQQEFQRDRDAFLEKHAPPAAPVNMIQWHDMYRALQNLDLQYPQPRGLADAPAELSSELASRRDAELIRAVDAIFNQDNPDPSTYTTELADVRQVTDAVVTARYALASADLTMADACVKDFQEKLESLESVDATASALFDPVQQEFRPFIDARTSTDRPALLIAVSKDSLPLSIRLRSWLRLSKAGMGIWPDDLPSLATDHAQGDRLAELSKDVSPTQKLIASEQKNRLDAFFASLHDEPAVRDAIKQSTNPQLAGIAPLYPQWFRYDIALAGLKQGDSPLMTQESTSPQIHAFLELADKVHAPTAAELRAAFTAVPEPVKTLATAGPAGAAGWQLAPGSDADHRTYVLGNESLEFIRVRQRPSNGGMGADCYLSTTEVPVSLLQKVLNKDHPAQRQAAQILNQYTQSVSPAMAIWSFAADGIKLDDRDYKSCFLLAPTAHLPAQFVTPEMAFYIARLVGCRLPTSDEWHGALAQVTVPTADPYQWGFAMRDWKLRDSDFLAAMNRAEMSRPPQYWPDDNIFRPANQTLVRLHAQDSRIWSAMDLASLAGHIAPVASANATGADDALPMAPGHLGFREVDDGAHYTGVFHDLIGNAAEMVLDVQGSVAENLDITNQPVDTIKSWFTPDRESQVAIIGGSALSPPSLDPLTAYPLAAGAPVRAFADVGFRLAFSDPQSTEVHDPAKLRALAVEHSALIFAGPFSKDEK